MADGTGGAAAPGGCYVYGVMERAAAGADLGDLPTVGDGAGAPLRYVTHGDLAAAVSDLRAARPLGTPQDLRVHAGVLDAIAATGAPVLPFRFGTVLGDDRAVAADVLAGAHDAFAAALDRLRGRSQFTLRAHYEEDALLRELPAEHPEIEEARRALADRAREGASPQEADAERVRLGELLAQAIEARRATDADQIHGSLAPVALAAKTADSPEEDGVVDASFLVEGARRTEFEQAAEDLARDWHGRVRLQLLGPLAPYDFAADAMAGDGGVFDGDDPPDPPAGGG